jgi:hypothetical protein
VRPDNYTLHTADVPAVQDGQVLLHGRYYSVDPYMRIQQSAMNSWAPPHPLNEVQGGGVLGEVIESRDASLKPGDMVFAYMGWQEYAVVNAKAVQPLRYDAKYHSYGLGVLGMPGRTAYFSLLNSGKPKAGETLVVSGAAGAVGSIVGQMGKILGLRVIGIAGTPDKCDVLTKEYGFDAAVNYRDHPDAESMGAALKAVCPNGIDIYYDNTGGYITDSIFPLINVFARIIICGQISQYNGALDKPNLGPRMFHHVLYKRATIQGILVTDYVTGLDKMVEQMLQWLEDGKLKYHETVVDGFENLPNALCSMMKGANVGKMYVRAY